MEQYTRGLEYDKKGEYESAYKCYYDAAILGIPGAQHSLGACFYNGEGVAKDLTLAIKWFRSAAELNDGSAQLALAETLYEINPNDPEAFMWIKKAIVHGHEIPQSLYAGWLLKLHDKKTTEEAIQICRKLAMQKNTSFVRIQQRACLRLSQYYEDKGMYQASFLWDLRAANLTSGTDMDIIAIDRLAQCYLEGIGCAKDLELFHVWNAKLPIEERFEE